MERLTKKVAISAGHNLSESQEAADREILAKAARDKRAGRLCISHGFKRVEGALVDESKPLMPVFQRVPLIAHKLIRRVRQGLKVVVIGSDEVALVVESVRDCFGIESSVLRHTDEFPSLAQNIAAGARALNLGTKEGFVFESADTPYATIEDLLTDEDIREHILVADLNGRQTAFAGTTQFFPRNFYWQVQCGRRYIDAKEPNTWLFREDFPFHLIDTFYDNRQGGKQDILMILKLLDLPGLKDLKELPRSAWHDAYRGLMRVAMNRLTKQSTTPWRFHATTVTDASRLLLKGPTARFKVTHNDPFRMKDIDAWHDLWFYHHLVNESIRRHGQEEGLSRLAPDAKEIIKYSEFVEQRGIANQIGVLSNFPQYANDRARALQLPYQPFSRDGTFRAPLEDGADIPAALEFLARRNAA